MLIKAHPTATQVECQVTTTLAHTKTRYRSSHICPERTVDLGLTELLEVDLAARVRVREDPRRALTRAANPHVRCDLRGSRAPHGLGALATCSMDMGEGAPSMHCVTMHAPMSTRYGLFASTAPRISGIDFSRVELVEELLRVGR